jgi:esterase/lipase
MLASKFHAVLRFLNLLDRAGKLSLTNLALWVLLVKVAMVGQLSVADAAVFFLGVLNYAHKRHETTKYEKQSFDTQESKFRSEVDSIRKQLDERISAVKDEVGKVALSANMFRK